MASPAKNLPPKTLVLVNGLVDAQQQEIPMNRPQLNLDAIFKHHEIHPNLEPRFRALVERGEKPDEELKTRLATCDNYGACLLDILERLSQPFIRLLEPINARSPGL
jgi:hypothetical protein